VLGMDGGAHRTAGLADVGFLLGVGAADDLVTHHDHGSDRHFTAVSPSSATSMAIPTSSSGVM
jgi:hypothetical protein